MKKDLLGLISQIDNIRSHFHITGGNGIPLVNVIYDRVEFSIWKQEIQFKLQDIYDQTKDKSIWRALVILNQDFNGWKDEQSFNELSGSLFAIQKSIDRYYLVEAESFHNIKEVLTMKQKSPKIFISHFRIKILSLVLLIF
jgi:hypothetical protein